MTSFSKSRDLDQLYSYVRSCICPSNSPSPSHSLLQSVATSLSENHRKRDFTRYRLNNYNKWSLLKHHVNL